MNRWENRGTNIYSLEKIFFFPDFFLYISFGSILFVKKPAARQDRNSQSK